MHKILPGQKRSTLKIFGIQICQNCFLPPNHLCSSVMMHGATISVPNFIGQTGILEYQISSTFLWFLLIFLCGFYACLLSVSYFILIYFSFFVLLTLVSFLIFPVFRIKSEAWLRVAQNPLRHCISSSVSDAECQLVAVCPLPAQVLIWTSASSIRVKPVLPRDRD